MKAVMGKLPANLAALYGVQIAQGLTISHQNNLFHGLIKPSNIMVGSDNQARILDFGLVRKPHAETSLTSTGFIVGTCEVDGRREAPPFPKEP